MLTAYIYDGVEYRLVNRRYAVSKCGKVLRKTRGELAPYIPKLRKDGYLEAGKNGLVHRLVALCWLERPEVAKIVHHKDGSRTNNDADNLEWLTQKEHMGEKHSGVAGHYVRTDSTRMKMRALRLGTKDSADVRAKKKTILLRVSLRKNACRIDGVEYRSFLAASKTLGIHFHTIRYRCLSKNFPNYSLVTIS